MKTPLLKRRKGRVVMFGYTNSTEAALAELQEIRGTTGVVVVSKNSVPAMEGVTHVSLDYLKDATLRDRRVALESASVCVVFAEAGGRGDATADMHTVLAVYNVRKAYPEVPIIAEIVDRENTTFIDELGCADVIYKETIDRNLITSCILHPNISPIFYDLLTVRGKVLRTTVLEELGFPAESTPVTYHDVRLKGLERDVTFLGYIDDVTRAALMPPNETEILPHSQLVYIE